MLKIKLLPSFERSVKRLKKRFPRIADDMLGLLDALERDPHIGTDLGNGLRKIRWRNSSKNTGKSGGYRIVTYYVLLSQEDSIVHLVEIWDKSERESIETDTLRAILDEELG